MNRYQQNQIKHLEARINLLSEEGGTSVVRGRPACSTAILQGNLTFILTETKVMVKVNIYSSYSLGISREKSERLKFIY